MSPRDPHTVTVEVAGRRLRLTNLDRVLFPAAGMTKAQVIQYVTGVAPALLGQLRNRPLTRVRYPRGTTGEGFFEKNVPGGAPAWVRRVTLLAPHSRREDELVTYPLIDDAAGLTWLANLAALELHVPQWRVAPGSTTGDGTDATPLPPDRLVIDLDPGPPAGLTECAAVALLVRDALAARGLSPAVPVTSGSKGLQVYAAWPSDRADVDPSDLAHELARDLEGRHRGLVVSSMAKAHRAGRVFLDWSQNAAAKTTICPYSLRGKRDEPFVAAPRTWAEIIAGADEPGALRHLPPEDVLARLSTDGDLMAALDDQGPPVTRGAPQRQETAALRGQRAQASAPGRA